MPCGPLNAYRREIQDLRSRRLHTVLPDADVGKVAEIMLDEGVDAVPVVTIGSDFSTYCGSHVRRMFCPFTLGGQPIFVELILTSD